MVIVLIHLTLFIRSDGTDVALGSDVAGEEIDSTRASL